MSITIQGLFILINFHAIDRIIVTVQGAHSHFDIAEVEVVVGGGGGFGVLVVEHGAVGVAQFLHDGALVDIGTCEFLALVVVRTVVGKGAVDVAVAGGGDVALVAGLRQQQVAVGTVTQCGQIGRRQCLDKGEGTVGVGCQQAVGRREPRIIARLAPAACNRFHECQRY